MNNLEIKVTELTKIIICPPFWTSLFRVVCIGVHSLKRQMCKVGPVWSRWEWLTA